MTASNQTETIDAYLRGELSPPDLASFEAKLKADPLLTEELAFQQSVVAGIQESRKLELKNRLSQIDVSGTAVPSQLGTLKIVGGVLLVAVMGYATYQFWPEKGPFIEKYGPDVKEGYLQDIPFEVPEPVPAEDLIVFEEATPEEEKTVIVQPNKQTVTEINETEVAQETAPQKEIAFEPQVTLPDEDGEDEGPEFQPEELAESFPSSNDTKAIDVLNIERIDEKSKKLRYHYYDGKLALYGDFGDLPYQILEINQKDGGKQIYLLHNELFYGLEVTKEERPLLPISDPALLNELQVFQDEK